MDIIPFCEGGWSAAHLEWTPQLLPGELVGPGLDFNWAHVIHASLGLTLRM